MEMPHLVKMESVFLCIIYTKKNQVQCAKYGSHYIADYCISKLIEERVSEKTKI